MTLRDKDPPKMLFSNGRLLLGTQSIWVACFPKEIPYNLWVGNGTLYLLLWAPGSHWCRRPPSSVYHCAPYWFRRPSLFSWCPSSKPSRSYTLSAGTHTIRTERGSAESPENVSRMGGEASPSRLLQGWGWDPGLFLKVNHCESQ